MKRLVKMSDRFTGRISLMEKAEKMANKMTNDGLFGMLLDKEEDGSVINVHIDATEATANKTIALFPGALATVEEIRDIAGAVVDMIAKHGANSEGITIDCPFLAFYQQEMALVPCRVKSLQVNTDNATQFGFPIEMAGFDLTRKDGQDRIVLTKYKSAKNSNDCLVNVDDIAWMQLDRYKVLYLTVGAGRKVDLSFEIGERFNSSKILAAFAEFLMGV